MARGERSKTVRVTDDVLAGLIRSYKDTDRFKNYAAETQALWGRELDFASRPDTLGAVSCDEIRPALVQAYIDGMSGRPAKQAAAVAALRALEKWAIKRDLLPRQITLGVEVETSEGGHVPWSDEQVAIAETNARPDLARAVTLAACTGQRGSDLVRLGPTDVEVYEGRAGINVRQIKTGKVIWIPIVSTLADAMAGWERTPGPWLRRPDGKPWKRRELTAAWNYERDHNQALAPLRRPADRHWAPLSDQGLVLHGLRGTACVRLRRAGATEAQISSMVGLSMAMVERYCHLSAQRENALAAVVHLENRREQKPMTTIKPRL